MHIDAQYRGADSVTAYDQFVSSVCDDVRWHIEYRDLALAAGLVTFIEKICSKNTVDSSTSLGNR